MPMSCASPSWRTPVAPLAVVGLAVTACLAGVLFGSAYYLVSRVFDLFVALALLAGLMVATPVESAARRLRVRNHVVIGLCGALAGATCAGTKQTLRGDHLVRTALAEPSVPPLVRSMATAALRQPRQRLRMAWRAMLTARLQVVRFGAITNRVQGPAVWVVLALDLLACAYAAGSQSRDSFRHHWCPECDTGCQPEVLLEVPADRLTELCWAIDNGIWTDLDRLRQDTESGPPTPRVNLEQCSEPAHGGFVSLRDAQGRYLRSWQVSPGEVAALRRTAANWAGEAEETVDDDPITPQP